MNLPLISVWQWQTAAEDFVCIGLFTDGEDARRLAVANPNECVFGGQPVPLGNPMRKPACVIKHDTLEDALDQIRKPTREAALEEAAKLCDAYGREGERTAKEYACETADEIAARIRALPGSAQKKITA